MANNKIELKYIKLYSIKILIKYIAIDKKKKEKFLINKERNKQC